MTFGLFSFNALFLLLSCHSPHFRHLTVVSLLYYHQLRKLSIKEIQELRDKKEADYLAAFPRKSNEPGFQWVLDGVPKTEPQVGDCLGPFVQRVLGVASGAPSIPIVQNLTEQNVEFCWKTTTELLEGRFRMYLRTTKAIEARDRLELLTTYGSSHILKKRSGNGKKKK